MEMLSMAACRPQTLATEQPLPSSAGSDLSSHYTNWSRASRNPFSFHCCLYKRNLRLPLQTDKYPHPCFASSYGFHNDPLCRTGCFSGICSQNALGSKGVRMLLTAHIRVPHDSMLFRCFSLGMYRQNASYHIGKASNFRIWHTSGSLSRTSACVAAAWKKDREIQMAAFAEQSNSANEEILLFFFQLDLTTRLQRALNLDQYEAAQQLREKIVEVDKEISRLTEAKLGSAPSKDEAQDKAITILRLKNDLQQAVQEEDYNGAAELRDQISKLEAESLAAAARALVFQNVQYAFRLGQKVIHCKFGYRGVICGMDPLCSESDNWSSSAHVQNLPRGKNQPFYQVLVDMRAEPELLVAYVAEDNLMPPKEPDKANFDHPYVSFLFYGMDSAGDFIPIKQLREKYNQPRHELPWDEGKDTTADDGDVKP